MIKRMFRSIYPKIMSAVFRVPKQKRWRASDLHRADSFFLRAAGATRSCYAAHWMRPVARLVREADHWHAVDQHGLVIACAPVVIIAAAHHTARLGGLRDASARAVRGQLTIAPRIAQLPLALPVIGGGYAVPLPDQKLMIGASYDFDDDPLPRA